MNAFVTPFAAASTASRPRTLCAARPAAPFFASTAFGAPVVTPAQAPSLARAPVRMEVTIVVGENEPVESALRRFKKDVSKSGHLFELRRRRYFETNTEKRIRKAAAARRKAKMARNESRRTAMTGAARTSSSPSDTSARNKPTST